MNIRTTQELPATKIKMLKINMRNYKCHTNHQFQNEYAESPTGYNESCSWTYRKQKITKQTQLEILRGKILYTSSRTQRSLLPDL